MAGSRRLRRIHLTIINRAAAVIPTSGPMPFNATKNPTPSRRGSLAWLRYKLPRAVGRRIEAAWTEARDRLCGTFRTDASDLNLGRFLDPVLAVDAMSHTQKADLVRTARDLVAHRFDLLGSGSVTVAHGTEYPGFLGYRYAAVPREGRVDSRNRRRALSIASLIDPGYRRIDWQVDFRSGYRWSELRHALRQPIGRFPGADIKVPWELGKLQHLATLALAREVEKRRDGGEAHIYEAAFRNQALDFISGNPPGFGVHWHPAMLPAIRGANLLVAWDLFCSGGAVFDPAFEAVLAASAWEHAGRVVNHLEWWDFDERNNHYMADVAGLAVIAAYLPASPVSDTWMSFAAAELAREVLHQFHEDGSSIEESTAYHAFSLDAAIWGLSFSMAAGRARGPGDPGHLPRVVRSRLRRLGAPRPDGGRLLDRVRRATTFLEDVTPDDRLIQIGDNDSGRFMRLFPEWRGGRPDLMNYRGVRGAAAAFVEGSVHGPEAALIGALCPTERGDGMRLNSRLAPSGPDDQMPAGAVSTTDVESVIASASALPETRRRSLYIELPSEPSGWWSRAYPGFGLWVYGREKGRLTVRCGFDRASGGRGHAHDDQLAVALWFDGRVLVDDPGSFVYTADPETRARFRSRDAHFVPALDSSDEAVLVAPVFGPPTDVMARAIAWDANRFIGRQRLPGGTVYRMVECLPDAVRVTDFSFDAFVRHPAERLEQMARNMGSDGYGVWRNVPE